MDELYLIEIPHTDLNIYESESRKIKNLLQCPYNEGIRLMFWIQHYTINLLIDDILLFISDLDRKAPRK